jgi:hypothetical protein
MKLWEGNNFPVPEETARLNGKRDTPTLPVDTGSCRIRF